jgi:hypothetical protein
MTSYTAITEAETNPEAPLTSVLAKRFRDNPIAISEGATSSPITRAAWHPYNKITVGDANTGIIYSFPTNGALATVTSPDFEDGYEYAFLIDQIKPSGGAGSTLGLNLYRETSAAYAGVFTSTISVGTTNPLLAWIELPLVREARAIHFISSQSGEYRYNNNVGLATVGTIFNGVAHATVQKILRVQFSFGGNNITGGSASTGTITMFRRKEFI